MMKYIITCCVILNNIIVYDEYETEDCTVDYLIEDADKFSVDPVECTGLADSHLFCNHLSTVQAKYMSQKTRFFS